MLVITTATSGVEPGTMSNAKHRFDLPSFCAEKKERPRVPDTVQLGAISPFPAFLTVLKLSNLRVLNTVIVPTSPASTNCYWAFSSQAVRVEKLGLQITFAVVFDLQK